MKTCMRCGKEMEGSSSFCDECKEIVQPVENLSGSYVDQYVQQQSQQTDATQQTYYQQQYYQQYYQQPTYYQQSYYQPAKKPDAPSGGLFALSFFFHQIGLALYLVWKDEYPLKAKSCGKGALIGFCIAVGLVFFLPFIIAMFSATAYSSSYYYYSIPNIISSVFFL